MVSNVVEKDMYCGLPCVPVFVLRLQANEAHVHDEL